MLQEGLANQRPAPSAMGPPPATWSTCSTGKGSWDNLPFNYTLSGLCEKLENANQQKEKDPQIPPPRDYQRCHHFRISYIFSS